MSPLLNLSVQALKQEVPSLSCGGEYLLLATNVVITSPANLLAGLRIVKNRPEYGGKRCMMVWINQEDIGSMTEVVAIGLFLGNLMGENQAGATRKDFERDKGSVNRDGKIPF